MEKYRVQKMPRKVRAYH